MTCLSLFHNFYYVLKNLINYKGISHFGEETG
jgi:hypothetical protein